jgi:hypothetical protein
MSKKRKPPLFYRSFHLTLGGIALLLTVFIWIKEGGNYHTWPLRGWVILAVLLFGGAYFFVFGLLASDQKIESTRIVATEGNLLMAVLATPLYLVMRCMQRKKREQTLGKKHDHVA